MSRIRRDHGIVAINNRGWCIDGTSWAYEKISITKTGLQTFTHTVEHDCYLLVTVHVYDVGSGSFEGGSHIRLNIGDRQVFAVPEPMDSSGGSDRLAFGLHVKAGAIATLSCNVHTYEDGSFVNFQELKLS